MEEGSDKGYDDIKNIIAALNSKDALKILELADKGIISSEKNISQLGMTRRRYYRRLKELVDVGLLRPEMDKSNKYTLTLLGKIFYNTLFRDVRSLLPSLTLAQNLMDIKDRGELEVFERLTKSVDDSVLSIILSADLKPYYMKVLDSYDDLVDSINREINVSKKQILLSSSYLDFSVVKNLVNAVERGVKLYGIMDKSIDLSKVLSFVKNFINIIRSSDQLIRFLRSPNVSIRKGEIPYSFLVIDVRTSFFEIPLSGSDEFFTAFKIKDEIIADKFATVFWKVWERCSPLRLEKYLNP